MIMNCMIIDCAPPSDCRTTVCGDWHLLSRAALGGLSVLVSQKLARDGNDLLRRRQMHSLKIRRERDWGISGCEKDVPEHRGNRSSFQLLRRRLYCRNIQSGVPRKSPRPCSSFSLSLGWLPYRRAPNCVDRAPPRTPRSSFSIRRSSLKRPVNLRTIGDD